MQVVECRGAIGAEFGKLTVLAVAAIALAVGACSSTPSRFQASRPAYGLTGGTGNMQAAPQPSASVHSNGPTARDVRGDDPYANAVYRGGRDPVSGKAPAPSWNGGHSADPRSNYAPSQMRADAGRSARRPQVAGRTVVEVAEGDTLYGLSTRYRVSMNAIMLANGLTEPTLTPGQRVMIPAR